MMHSAPPIGETPALEGTQASSRLLAYLRRLPMTERERLELSLSVVEEALSGGSGREDLELASMRILLDRLGPPDLSGFPRAAPPVRRIPMAPEFPGPVRAHDDGQGDPEHEPLENRHGFWAGTALRRRLLLLGLVTGPTVLAAMRMASLLPHKGGTALEVVLVGMFAVLFAWISIGFWTAVAGFVILLSRYDRFKATSLRVTGSPERPEARAAVVFPVYGEDMARVCAGLEAVYRSVERAGSLNRMDFFILSDTRDPEAWVLEERAWAGLVRRAGAQGRIFYRRRTRNIKKKSGNIADFCRRFGSSYTYMLVMDADSVMSGSTILAMMSVMERERHVGILQSVPGVVGRDTLLARVQQFSNRLYGPLFAAGFHFWLLGDSQFWGHNALIRIRPFMRHCALPRLPGKPPLGGEILSHDFVESTLMRRAGWGVWLAYDLPGSYEETPTNIVSELARDRRWCKGNMQHLWLVFAKGLSPVHRVLFINGVMSYGSALLWFLFLALSTAEAVMEALTPPVYFPAVRTLFPAWPIWEPWWALSLLLTTGVLLFLPKLLSLILALARGGSGLFGGFLNMGASILLEVVASSFLAPIRMLFHARFVFMTLIGQETDWRTQPRDDRPLSWPEAARFLLGGTLLALAWAGMLHVFNERFFWWVSPIFIPLLASIPVAVLTSRPGVGRWLREGGFLLIPEEAEPPRELSDLARFHGANMREPLPLGLPGNAGLALAVADPSTCALRLCLIGGRGHAIRPDAIRRDLLDRAARLGPNGLNSWEKKRLLDDPAALWELHRAVWLLPAGTLKAKWFVELA